MELTARETHFDFGKNWRSLVDGLTARQIDEAVNGLRRLFPQGLEGKRFLDIGCGSGLVMLAALRLGAKEVIGVDIDEDSVAATRRTLTTYAPASAWSTSQVSVFDLPSEQYDVVHSWGVLHHTGAMWRAVEKAASMAKDQLAIALYTKTACCPWWRPVKRLYSASPAIVQIPMQWAYKALFLLGKVATGQNPIAFVRDYYRGRGMSWTHDVHDWMGGYPYESASPAEVHAKFRNLGFTIEREYLKDIRLGGLFGSGCDEYVARKR